MVLPSPYDLATLDQVKGFLSANGTVIASTDDDNIQRLLTACSRRILSRCGNGAGVTLPEGANPFAQALTVTDTYSGNGRISLWTRMFPIQSVQSLVINNVAIPASTGFNAYGYQIADDRKSIVLAQGFAGVRITNGPTLLGVPSFVRGVRNVVLNYTAGFPAQPVSAELHSIPNDGNYLVTVDDLPWVSDSGVTYFSDGSPLTRVNVQPAQGQYYVVGGGVYLFSSADAVAGNKVQISYESSGCPDDLAEAAIMGTSFWYTTQRMKLGLKSEMISGPGGGTSSYEKVEFPAPVETILDDYSRVAVVR